MMVRFATLCDECEARSEEYTAWPTCRDCQRDICPACAAPGSVEDEEHERGVRQTCLCADCAATPRAWWGEDEEDPMMTIHFDRLVAGRPAGKLAEAEIRFTDGPFAGLKLVGFAVWERKRGGRTVTFPARQYTVAGERRSYALLRPIDDAAAVDRLRDLILDAYAATEAHTPERVS
jgi:hypothetical protein